MMKIHKTQANALAAFIATVRADWDTPGIITALGNAKDRGDVWEVSLAAIRAAGDPANKTPAVIAMDGRHWRPGTDEPAPPKHPPFCKRCFAPHWDHAKCQPVRHVPPDADTPGAAAFRRAREAAKTEEDT